MSRLRALAGLGVLAAVEAGAWVALRAAGRVEAWRVDTSHLWRWLGQAPPADVAAGLGRLAAEVIVAWLAVTTAAYLLASLTRIPALVRLVAPLTAPGVRRLVERVAVVGVGATMLLPAGAAFAHDARPVGGWQNPPAATVVADGPQSLTTAVAPTPEAAGEWPTVAGDNLWWDAEAVVARDLGVPVESLTPDQIAPYWSALCETATGSIRSGDPNLIFPGERIVLPRAVVVDGVVTALDGPAPAVTAPAPAPPVVAPVPVPAPAPAPPVTAAPPTTVATTVPVTVAPPTTARTPASTPVAAVSDESDSEAPSVTSSPDPAPEAVQRPSGATMDASASPWGLWRLVGAGLFCFGIVKIATNLRRARARRRLPGEGFLPSPEDVATVEVAVLVGADAERAAFLEAALRAFAAAVGEPDRYSSADLPAPLGVVVGPERLDIVLAEPSPAPAPFAAVGDRWTVRRSALVDSATAPIPSPALVNLGRDADGDEVLLDLEDPGLVSVVGPGASEIVTAAGIALATSPWSEFCSLLLVGFTAPPVLDGVRAVDALTEADFEALEDEAARVAGRLAAADVDSTYEARVRGVVDDVWMPTVVVCATTPDPSTAARLVGLVNDPAAAGVGVLVAGVVAEAPWVLTVGRDGLALDALGVLVTDPHGVDTATERGIRDVLEAAAAEPVPVAPLPSRAAADAPEILVRVLGPITVDGLSWPDGKNRAKGIESLVYQAVNRHREVDGDRLSAALWPDAALGGNLRTVNWALRQHLGRSAVTGEFHLRSLKGGERLYGPALADTVDCDLCLVESALEEARTSSSSETAARLRAALALVRGPAFDHCGRGYEWARAEGVAARAERAVVDAAHRLAEIYLTQPTPDPERAVWAARAGLLAAPESELLARMEMRAQHALGDLGAVEAVFARVAEAAEADDLEPDPTTVALRRELLDAR